MPLLAETKGDAVKGAARRATAIYLSCVGERGVYACLNSGEQEKMYALIAVVAIAQSAGSPSVLGSGAAPASGAPMQDAPVAISPQSCCVLPKLSPVFLTIEEPVESDKAIVGQTFAIKLAKPLYVAEALTLPTGTSGLGEVIHAAKSRAMGKPGELLLAARYLDWNGIRIPLRSFRFGDPQGKDNSGTAAVVGIAVSALVTPFITGGEVRIPAGATGWAKVAADIALAQPGAATTTATPIPTSINSGGKL